MNPEQTTDQLADEIAATHADWFRLHPSSSLLQTCLIFPENGDPFAVGCPWGDADERRLILAMLRAMMVRERAVRYAFWSETWMKFGAVPPGQKPEDVAAKALDEYEFGDLALDPERIEAVLTLVVEASGKQATRVQKIVRGRRGGVRALEPLGEPGEDKWDGFGGDLCALLPPRTFN